MSRNASPLALDFGAVWINCHIPLVAEMPHGGFKYSGYGKESLGLRSRGLHPSQARHEFARLSRRPSCCAPLSTPRG